MILILIFTLLENTTGEFKASIQHISSGAKMFLRFM